MTRAKERPTQLPALRRIPPVADHALFVVIPNPAVFRTAVRDLLFPALKSGDPITSGVTPPGRLRLYLYNDRGARSKTIRMTLLHIHKSNLPGMILLHKRTGSESPTGAPNRVNYLRISMFREFRGQKRGAIKSRRMISLYNVAK